MKQQIAVEQFLAGRRMVIAKFVAHRQKEVQNKAKKVVGIVNLYEVQCADGKAPTVQTWCPWSRNAAMHGGLVDWVWRRMRRRRAAANPSLSERSIHERSLDRAK